MSHIEYHKLIRDRIPEIMDHDNVKYETRILNDEEYRIELLKKLIEEAQEAVNTQGVKAELTKEIGDLMEVIDYVIKVYDLNWEEINQLKQSRHNSRGGFEQKIFLEYTE